MSRFNLTKYFQYKIQYLNFILILYHKINKCQV
ncbi:hypothetical protein ACQ27_gp536 [Klebsiella phage K64-1]|nr:hypothetical protein ACQ27_gp536 [Klebsiella phage K64-1]